MATRSEGNPFYVEELLNFIVSHGIDAGDPTAIEAVSLPDSLHTPGPEPDRRRRRGAAPDDEGRERCRPRIRGADAAGGLPRSSAIWTTVLDHLDALRTLDLVALDREAEQAWMFKHVVTQEVAYESLPFALRAVLHGLVGDHIERSEADDLDRYVPLLEHHFWRSDREDKKVLYLRKAAEMAQASYANQRPRSPTTTGWSRCSTAASASRRCSRSARSSSSPATGDAPHPSPRRRSTRPWPWTT